MAALSDYSEKLLLDWMLTSGAVQRPTSLFLALYIASPSDSGGGTEVSGAGYSRQNITFSPAVSPGGTCSNNSIITFTANGGSFGTVTHIGIFDSLSGGNLLWHGQLLVSKTILDGDSLQFGIGNIKASLE